MPGTQAVNLHYALGLVNDGQWERGQRQISMLQCSITNLTVIGHDTKPARSLGNDLVGHNPFS